MSSILEKVKADLVDAMKARDETRKNVLRSLKAAIDKEMIDKGTKGEDMMVSVIGRQKKQRIESANAYRENGDENRAKAEEAEADIIAKYLPEQLGQKEVADAINEAVSKTGASAPSDMGKVMGLLSKKLAGKTDMKEVAERVREMLGA